MEIYRQMYKEAEPSLDFDKALKDGTTAKENWFMDYYLPTKHQEEIVDYWLKKHRCNTLERKMIRQEIWLGSSPNGLKR